MQARLAYYYGSRIKVARLREAMCGIGVWRASGLDLVSPYAVMYSMQHGFCNYKEVMHIVSRTWEMRITRFKNVASIWRGGIKIGTMFVPSEFRTLAAGTSLGCVCGTRISLSLPKGYKGFGPCVSEIETMEGRTTISLRRMFVKRCEFMRTENLPYAREIEEKCKAVEFICNSRKHIGFLGKLFGYHDSTGLFGSVPPVSDLPIVSADGAGLFDSIGEDVTLSLSLWLSLRVG